MVPDQGLNLQSLCWMHRVITSGPPGKFPGYLLLYRRRKCRASEPMFSSDGWRQRQGSESFTSIKCTQLTPSNGRAPSTASPSRVSFQKAGKGRNSTAPAAPPQGPDPASQALCILFQLENEAISSISTLSAGLHFFFLSWLKLYSSCKISTEFFGDSYLYSAEHFSKKC